MRRPKRSRPVRSAGAILGPDLLIAAPMRTLSDEYRDDPTEPVDPDRVPEPDPPGLVRRIVDRPALERDRIRR